MRLKRKKITKSQIVVILPFAFAAICYRAFAGQSLVWEMIPSPHLLSLALLPLCDLPYLPRIGFCADRPNLERIKIGHSP